MSRFAWMVLLGFMGCQTLAVPDMPARSAAALEQLQAPEARGPAPSHPSRPPGASSSADPADPVDQYLTLAADSLEKKENARALFYLAEYVSLRPGHLLVRLQYAELLHRESRLDSARLQFEVFIALAQDQGDRAFKYLIHSHSRLVEIAEQSGDAYQEHLHRGIGLYLLACRRAAEEGKRSPAHSPSEATQADGLTSASIFSRSAGELLQARNDQPDQSRPHLYLACAYRQLGQHLAAVRAQRQADNLALLSPLTPQERRLLQTLCLEEAIQAPSRPAGANRLAALTR